MVGNEISSTQQVLRLKPNLVQKGYRIGLREPVNQITHLVNRSQGFIRTHSAVNAAQPLRYCRATARHQKSRTLQSKQRRKKEKKNEQQGELEAFTSQLSPINL